MARFDLPGIATPPIGLDIGERTIKAVQCARGAGRGELARVGVAASIPRVEPGGPPTQREIERLRGVLERRGFAGRRVVAAVPEERLLSTAIELPGQGAVPMAAVSRVELARAGSCSPQSLEVAAWPLPAPARARGSSHVLAVGCTHRDAESWLEAVESGGLIAAALDARPMAMARAAAPLLGGRAGICALVDLDWSGTTTVVVYGGSIIYHRFSPDLGAGPALGAVRDGLGVSDRVAHRLLLGTRVGGADGAGTGPDDGTTAALIAEHLDELADEVAMAISYASHRYPEPTVELVLIAGDGASIRGLPAHVSRRLEVPARPLDPAEVAVFEGTGCEEGSRQELLVALGLSLWTEEASQA